MVDVPSGYKQTKVGVVPEDWEETELSSFIDEKIIYCNDEKVSLGSLTIESGVIPKPAQYKREHLVKDTVDAYKLVETSDFAYNPMNLRFGALALYKNNIQLKVSSYYNIFNVDENIVDIDYIYAYFKSEKIMFYYNRMAIGSLEEKKRVHFKEFRKFIFPLPPLKEQQTIAQILITWDDAISKQEKLIKVKERLKKGLMQKLLSGEVRFSGFDEAWEEVNLRDVAKIIMGQSPSSNSYNEEKIGIPLIQGNADCKNRKTIPRIYTTEKTKECNIGDIIMTVRAPVGAVSKSLHNACIGRGVCAIRPNDGNGFLYHFLVMYEEKWKKYSQGSTFTAVNSGDIKNLKIKLPAKQEQQKIAQVLTTADKEIELLKKELESLKEQKKGLMQMLLTGKVRAVI